ELCRQAEAVARGMISRGIRRGDRVGIFMPNCAEFMLAYFACHLLGAIVVTINARYKSHELAHALGFSDRRLLYTMARSDARDNSADLLSQTAPPLAACIADEPLALANAPLLQTYVLWGVPPRPPFVRLAALIDEGASLPPDELADLHEH